MCAGLKGRGSGAHREAGALRSRFECATAIGTAGGLSVMREYRGRPWLPSEWGRAWAGEGASRTEGCSTLDRRRLHSHQAQVEVQLRAVVDLVLLKPVEDPVKRHASWGARRGL